MNPELLIQKGLITEALDTLSETAVRFPGEGFLDRIDSLRMEFTMMQNYFLRGVNDPQRGELYRTLRGKVSNLAYDISVRESLRENPTIKSWLMVLRQRDNSPESLIESIKRGATDALSYCFFALVASYHWRNDTMNQWLDIILSLNESSSDGTSSCKILSGTPHVLVSAITISAMQHFSKQKALLLAKLYNRTHDESLRQRAFVGCVFALSMDRDPVYNKKRDEVLQELFTEKGSIKELIELQIQAILCTKAVDDAQKISKTIMPDIMKNQPFIVTRNGIVERDEKDLESIESTSIDEMEKNIQKVLKMQQQGSDIFFSGFRQMKRYPFFNKTVNWFCPFIVTHPDLQNTMQNISKSKFLDRVLEKGPFCNSDKYSFVFAMSQTMSMFSDTVKKQMEEGELGPIGMHDDASQMLSPSYQRRVYLQDLYRFYSLNPIVNPSSGTVSAPSQGLVNPFKDVEDFESWLIALEYITPSQLLEMGKYLIRRQYWHQLEDLLNCYPDQDCIELDFLSGELLSNQEVYGEAIDYYNSYLQEHPNHQPSMRGMAKAYYTCGDYGKASFYYDALRTLAPDKLSYSLNYSMSMVRDGKAETVINDLYRLNFEHPDDITIANTLGWALLYAEKPDKALSVYEKIPSDQLSADVSVYLNYMYAHFVTKFRMPDLKLKDSPGSEVITDEILQDSDMLKMYGISDAEISIMSHSI